MKLDAPIRLGLVLLAAAIGVIDIKLLRRGADKDAIIHFEIPMFSADESGDGRKLNCRPQPIRIGDQLASREAENVRREAKAYISAGNFPAPCAREFAIEATKAATYGEFLSVLRVLVAREATFVIVEPDVYLQPTRD